MATVVVLVADTKGDPATAAAFELIVQMAERGTVSDVITVHAGAALQESISACHVRHGHERAESELFESLVTYSAIERLRLVTVASAELADDAARDLGQAANRVRERLLANHPAGVPFIDARIIAPLDVEQQSALTQLFNASASANLVLIPEDRRSDSGFARPLSNSDSEVLAAHIAAEVATQAGLWTSMDDAPIDTSNAGVIGNADIRVNFVRSFARAVFTPPLPIAQAVSIDDVLPVPASMTPSPVPRRAATDFADSIWSSHADLQYQDPEAMPARRRASGIGETARLLLEEGGKFISTIPQQIRRGVMQDLDTAAGEALTNVVGEDSIIEVVWSGKAPEDVEDQPVVDIDELRRFIEQRVGSVEAAVFSQGVWTQVVDNVLASADGSPISGDLEPPSIGADRVLIADPKALAPAPNRELGAVLEDLNSDAGAGNDTTLLGRLSYNIRSEISRAETELNGLLTKLSEASGKLTSPRRTLAGAMSWFLAVAFAALICALIVFARLGESLGLDTLSPNSRRLIANVLSIGVVAAVAGLLFAGLRGSRRLKPALIGLGIVAVAGWVTTVSTWRVRRTLPDPIGQIRVGEAALVAMIIIVLVGALATLALERTQRARAAERLTGMIAIMAGVITVLAIVYQRGGWVETVPDEVFNSRRRRMIGSLLVANLGLLVALTVIRIREKFRIEDAQRYLRWAARAAEVSAAESSRLRSVLRQFHATAALISRTVWMPFGERAAPVDIGETPTELAMPIEKFRALRLEPTERELHGLIAKLRDEIAEPGWLIRQYSSAVDAFIPEYAFLTGQDARNLRQHRPEADAAPEDPALSPTDIGQGLRWQFASMLYRGEFDHDLALSGSRDAISGVLEYYFDSSAGTAFDRSNVTDLVTEMVSGESPELPIGLFKNISLPVAGDPRRQYQTMLFWPPALEIPTHTRQAEIKSAEIELDTALGVMVMMTRADWSQTFGLSTLPLHPGGSSPASGMGHVGTAIGSTDDEM